MTEKQSNVLTYINIIIGTAIIAISLIFSLLLAIDVWILTITGSILILTSLFSLYSNIEKVLLLFFSVFQALTLIAWFYIYNTVRFSIFQYLYLLIPGFYHSSIMGIGWNYFIVFTLLGWILGVLRGLDLDRHKLWTFILFATVLSIATIDTVLLYPLINPINNIIFLIPMYYSILTLGFMIFYTIIILARVIMNKPVKVKYIIQIR